VGDVSVLPGMANIECGSAVDLTLE